MAGDRERHWGKVSVVVSCYNYARFLPEALNSILNQTYKDIEIVVVNDGSTDNTNQVIKPFLKNPNLTYIEQSNSGHAVAKNVGVRRATGDFIAFLDSDDAWEPTKLEKQMPLFQNPLVGMVYARMRKVDEKGNTLARREINERLEPARGTVTSALFFDNFIPFSSTVVRRECFDKVGMMDETLAMGNDWDLWLRMSVFYQFDYVDDCLLRYREGHNGQMSEKSDMRQLCSDRIMKKFLQEHPGVLSKSNIRDAWAYTYTNRGYYFRASDLGKSTKFYLSALKCKSTEWKAYRGLLKNLICRLTHAC